MIVHVQTSIQSVFGRVDDNGDVVEQFPLNLTIQNLKPELFAELHKQLVARKEQLTQAEAQGPAPAGDAELVVPASKKSK